MMPPESLRTYYVAYRETESGHHGHVLFSLAQHPVLPDDAESLAADVESVLNVAVEVTGVGYTNPIGRTFGIHPRTTPDLEEQP